jgi:hypothetical protein
MVKKYSETSLMKIYFSWNKVPLFCTTKMKIIKNTDPQFEESPSRQSRVNE